MKIIEIIMFDNYKLMFSDEQVMGCPPGTLIIDIFDAKTSSHLYWCPATKFKNNFAVDEFLVKNLMEHQSAMYIKRLTIPTDVQVMINKYLKLINFS